MKMIALPCLFAVIGLVFLMIGYGERKHSTKFGRMFVNVFNDSRPEEVIKIGWLSLVFGFLFALCMSASQVWKMLFG